MSRGHVQNASHPKGRFTREADGFWTSCGQKRLKYSANEGGVRCAAYFLASQLVGFARTLTKTHENRLLSVNHSSTKRRKQSSLNLGMLQRMAKDFMTRWLGDRKLRLQEQKEQREAYALRASIFRRPKRPEQISAAKAKDYDGFRKKADSSNTSGFSFHIRVQS